MIAENLSATRKCFKNIIKESCTSYTTFVQLYISGGAVSIADAGQGVAVPLPGAISGGVGGSAVAVPLPGQGVAVSGGAGVAVSLPGQLPPGQGVAVSLPGAISGGEAGQLPPGAIAVPLPGQLPPGLAVPLPGGPEIAGKMCFKVILSY